MSPSAVAIRVRGLRKTYGKIRALEELGFEIPSGQVAGFLGPNGAGKTTTFRALLGLTRPEAGEIEVLGMRVPHDLTKITKRVGAIVEEPGLIKAHSGRVNMEIAADTLGFGHERIGDLLEFVGLTADANRKAEQYSKGMRQRLALATAMIGDPDLLLLDEPLDGLDPAGQHAFRARLRSLAQEGKTVVVSSHDLADIEALADYVVVINRGQLVTQGPLESLLAGGHTRVVTSDVEPALAALAASDIEAHGDDGGLVALSDDGARVIRVLTDVGIYPSEVRPERETLESVFLGITEEFGE